MILKVLMITQDSFSSLLFFARSFVHLSVRFPFITVIVVMPSHLTTLLALVNDNCLYKFVPLVTSISISLLIG